MMPYVPEVSAAVIEDELSRARIPGCSVALVDRSGPLWAAGFGFADLGRRRRATAETAYRLFSGTKLFTAVALLQLEERGLLSLDDPVVRHVPAAAAARDVTLLHLLSHRSGLRDTAKAFLSVSLPPESPPGTAAALGRFRIAPAGPPGRRVAYRNVNYALLGDVVTRVSGLEYRDYVSRHVLAPLGMRAGFHLQGEMRRDAATGYIGRWDPMRLALRVLFPDLPRRLYGDRVGGVIPLRPYDLATSAIGGLVGPVTDFAVFLRAQLSGGGGVLSAAATRRMQTQVADGVAGVESRAGMALGWKVGRVGARAFLNHEGAGAGFTSELRLYPEEGLGIALAMNTMRMPSTMRAAHRICERILETAVRDSQRPLGAA